MRLQGITVPNFVHVSIIPNDFYLRSLYFALSRCRHIRFSLKILQKSIINSFSLESTLKFKMKRDVL